MTGFKRVNTQFLQEHSTSEVHIRDSQRRRIKLPEEKVYPYFIWLNSVCIKKTSIGISFSVPMGMLDTSFQNWKRKNYALTSKIRKMTKEEWKIFAKNYNDE